MDYHVCILILLAVWRVFDLKKLQKVLLLWKNILSEYEYRDLLDTQYKQQH
jgi:hypothetical protein